MGFSRLEMETIIIFNALEKTAEVYTADPKMMRKMDKLCDESDEAILTNSDEGFSKTYQVPKSWVKMHKTRRLNLTEKQRQASAERLRKAREAKDA